jgi:hypothetical protein
LEGGAKIANSGGPETEGLEHGLTADEVLPELNCFFISASRHDRDRVELQLGFDGLLQTSDKRFNYDVDLLIFVPKTLGLREIDESSLLRQEFQSYVRLHTHASNPNSTTAELRVNERLNQLSENPSLENIRLCATEFDAFIRAQIKKIKKEIGRLDRKPEEAITILKEIEDLAQLMGRMRKFLAKISLAGKTAEEFEAGSVERNLLLLNEYLSHDYVHFLVDTHYAALTAPASEQLLASLDRLSREEAETRRHYGLLLEERRGPKSTENFDLYPRRLSLLKKYFHQQLFVEVTGQSRQTKAMIPVYAISAALAASWAIMVQLYQARTIQERVGINSILFITIAILGYVAKDIMKDFFRRYFYKTSSKFFPDFERTLWLRKGGRRQKLGAIREYLRILDSERLPEDLAKARYSASGGDMEEALHEDVLHFRKRVELELSHLETKAEFPWGLREILRFRFDRLLHSMEDAFKTLRLLGPTGGPSIRQGHRVYHIYMAAWIRRTETLGGQATKPAFKSFRITLDKTGVLGCESVKWKKLFGIPSVP